MPAALSASGPRSCSDSNATRCGVGVPAAGSTYVFNQSGQEIAVGGLLSLFDAEGPCANAVKDSQRTKTRPETTRTLSVLWSSRELGERLEAAGVTLIGYRALRAAMRSG